MNRVETKNTNLCQLKKKNRDFRKLDLDDNRYKSGSSQVEGKKDGDN